METDVGSARDDFERGYVRVDAKESSFFVCFTFDENGRRAFPDPAVERQENKIHPIRVTLCHVVSEA